MRAIIAFVWGVMFHSGALGWFAVEAQQASTPARVAVAGFWVLGMFGMVRGVRMMVAQSVRQELERAPPQRRVVAGKPTAVDATLPDRAGRGSVRPHSLRRPRAAEAPAEDTN